jgi:hypothetical protein
VVVVAHDGLGHGDGARAGLPQLVQHGLVVVAQEQRVRHGDNRPVVQFQVQAGFHPGGLGHLLV